MRGTSLSHASENFIVNLHSLVGQSRYKMSHQNIWLDAIENFYVYIVCYIKYFLIPYPLLSVLCLIDFLLSRKFVKTSKIQHNKVKLETKQQRKAEIKNNLRIVKTP